MSPPKRPNPKSERAQRLEQVREAVGLESLRKFWEALRQSGVDVSYEAVRNYHFDRDAPVEYYSAVSRVFRINLVWLIDGRGPQLIGEGVISEGGEKDPDAARLGEVLGAHPLVGGARWYDTKAISGSLIFDVLTRSGILWEKMTAEDIDLLVTAQWWVLNVPWLVFSGRWPMEEMEPEWEERYRLYLHAVVGAARQAAGPWSGDDARLHDVWGRALDVSSKVSSVVAEWPGWGDSDDEAPDEEAPADSD